MELGIDLQFLLLLQNLIMKCARGSRQQTAA
jgi:hypothetical protein